MMSFINWPELCVQVVLTLSHFLWQACVVAVLLLVVEWLCSAVARHRLNDPRSTANTDSQANLRYGLSCAALLSLPLCTAITFAWVHQMRGPIWLDNPAPAITNSEASPVTDRAEAPLTLQDVPSLPMQQLASQPVAIPPDASPTAAATSNAPIVAAPVTWTQRLQSSSPYVLIVYLLGLGLMLGRFMWSLLSSFRLRRTSQPVTDDDLLKMIRDRATTLGLKRVPAVGLCARVSVPVVMGIIRPIILLPPSLLSGLSSHQLGMILSHEMAHIRRHDLWLHLVQQIVESLLFFHPVTWWISRRVSLERENCCDDLAASQDSRVSYVAALLTVAEHCAAARGRQPTQQIQALAASGDHTSQLGYRIKRLLGEHTAPRLAISRGALAAIAMTVVLGGLSVAAVARTDSDADTPESTENDEQWGPVSHGLQLRVVPVSPDLSSDNVDMKAAVQRFASPHDIAFAVEIKNVSDTPIPLKTLHGDRNANYHAPNLFEFSFADMNGNPIARTHRDFTTEAAAVGFNGASTSQIQPGESVTTLLRPAQFLHAMKHRLPSGEFQVQVKYRGPSQAVKTWYNEHQPASAAEDVWSHQVMSNRAKFSIAPTSQQHTELVWGDEVDGLQAALEIISQVSNRNAADEQPRTSLTPILHIKNVSKKPITFVSETGRQGDRLEIQTADGTEIDVKDAFYTGWPIDVRWTLQPGEIAELDVLTPSLNQKLSIGEYRARYKIRFNSRKKHDEDGRQTFPAPGDYQSVLDTGWAPLSVHDPRQQDQQTAATEHAVSQLQKPFAAVDPRVHQVGAKSNWIVAPQLCQGCAYSATAKAASWQQIHNEDAALSSDRRYLVATPRHGPIESSVLPYKDANFHVALSVRLRDNATCRLTIGDARFDLTRAGSKTRLTHADETYPLDVSNDADGWMQIKISRHDQRHEVTVDRQPVITLGSPWPTVEQITLESVRGNIELKNFVVTGNTFRRDTDDAESGENNGVSHAHPDNADPNSASPAVDGKNQQATRTIRFQLVDGESGVPLSGIDCEANIFKTKSKPRYTQLKSGEDGIVDVTVRDGENAWISNVAAGWFTSTYSNVVIALDENNNPKQGQPARSKGDPIIIKLWQGTVMTGRLLWPDGTPAAGANLAAGVYIMNQTWKKKLGMDLNYYSFDHGEWPNWNRSVTTDRNGRFQVTIPPKDARWWYRIGTTSLGFSPQASTGTTEDVTKRLATCVPLEVQYGGSAAVTNITTIGDIENGGVARCGDLRLRTGVIVRGRVVDTEGNGLQNVVLTTTGPHGPHSGRRAISGEDGAFEFAAIARGSLTIHPDARLRDTSKPPPQQVYSRDVQGVFVDQTFVIPVVTGVPEVAPTHEITVQAVPHTNITFDWVDRRTDKSQAVAYYGAFRVRGHMPDANGNPSIYWTRETLRREHDGKTTLSIKVPQQLINAELILPADRIVTASYEDSSGTTSGPGIVSLGDLTKPVTRTIYGDEPGTSNN